VFGLNLGNRFTPTNKDERGRREREDVYSGSPRCVQLFPATETATGDTGGERREGESNPMTHNED